MEFLVASGGLEEGDKLVLSPVGGLFVEHVATINGDNGVPAASNDLEVYSNSPNDA